MTADFPEAEIEANVIAALRAGVPSAQIFGAWSVAAPGELKNLETAAVSAVLSVSVGIRRYDTAQIPTAVIPVFVSVSVREEEDPTGETFAAVFSAVASIFQLWQDDLAAAVSALSAPLADIVGFRMDGGNAPVRDGEAWSCLMSATIIAVVSSTKTNNNERKVHHGISCES